MGALKEFTLMVWKEAEISLSLGEEANVKTSDRRHKLDCRLMGKKGQNRDEKETRANQSFRINTQWTAEGFI